MEIHQTPPKYKNSTPSKYKNLLPLFVTNCQRQNQSSKGGGGGKAFLYSAKSALKEATFVNNSSRSCPWVACVVMKDSIMAWSERRIHSYNQIHISLLSSRHSTRGKGCSRSFSSWSLRVPVLGLALFIYVCRCIRKVAPMGAMMWTNSKGGNSDNPKDLKIL